MNPKSLIKFLLSASLLAIVLYSVDQERLAKAFGRVELSTVVLVVLGYFVGQLMSSVKWWTIARRGGINTPYLTALKAYFIGMFVNCFGLGMVGGDAARGILIAQGQPKKAEGIASVVVDRIHGLTVLCILALITSYSIGNDRVQPELLHLLLLLVVGFISAWIVGPWILTHIPGIKSTKLAAKLRHVAAIFPRDPKTISIITVISVVFHVLQISLHAVMAHGLGLSIPLSTLFVVIPFVNILSSLPISWNGLGVREKSYVFFLTSAPALMSQDEAVVFGALWLMAVTTTSAIGGIVALVSGDLSSLRAHKSASKAAQDSHQQSEPIPRAANAN